MSSTLALPAAVEFATRLVQAMGAPDAVAHDVAEHLLASDQAGYPSHGLSILPGYHAAALKGGIAVAAGPACIRDEGPVLGFDGRMGFGQHVGKVVFAQAIERARAGGVCVLTLRESCHLGRMGHYGEQAVAEGMALLAFTNVLGRAAMVAPFGGREPRLTTNPLCFAWPLADGRPPFVLDMATSAIALNKARVLAARGEPAPADALIDAAGRPTTDAAVMTHTPPGAILPFGGHKGYGLGVAVELFAGLLSGAGTVRPERQHGDTFAANDLFALIVDPARFADPQWLAEEADAYIDYLRACPPQPGFDAVQYPGEYEAAQRALHADAIELDTATAAALRVLADTLGVPFPVLG